MRRALTYALLLIAAMTLPVRAQQDTPPDDAPGGFLVGLLEDTFSGDNRAVRVVGLEGALSSRASIREIHVSDDRGEWLTLTGVVLDWNRAALLRGRFSVNELTAQSIEVIRRPVAGAPSGLPSPEAAPFALPDLPVSVSIAKLAIARVTLQKPVLGAAATFDLSGALTLADGALDARLGARRLDRTGDVLALAASYANDTRQIGLNLRLREAAGGLIATALAIPGAPQITLTARGDGPVTGFAADVRLSGNDVEWLSGRVALQGDADDTIAWFARLRGDIRPMLSPRHGAFFGPETRLDLTGRRQSDGRFSVDDLTLSTHALSLSGKLSLSAEGRPELVALAARIGLPGGDEVLLPIAGARTSLRGLEVNARFDASVDRNWRADLTLDGLRRADLALARATVTASGIYAAQGQTRLSGRIEGALSGLAPGDPGLSRAIGTALSLTGDFALPGDGTLRLSGFALRAKGLSALADLSIDGLHAGYRTAGDVTLKTADLARFSGLAGRDLGGDLSARLSGSAEPLGGGFDLTLSGTAGDLRLGDSRIDPLLAGQTRLEIDAARGAQGVEIRKLTLTGESLDADIAGTLRSAGSDLTLSAGLDNLGRLIPDLTGPVSAAGRLVQQGAGWHTTLTVDAPGGARAELDALVPLNAAAPARLDLSVTEPAGGPISTLLRLPARPALTLRLDGNGTLRDFSGNLGLATGGTDRVNGTLRLQTGTDGQADFSARMAGDFTPLVPPPYGDFFGPDTALDVAGQRDADGAIDLSRLSLTSRAMRLIGTARLDGDGTPQVVDLVATIGAAGGDQVLLPLPGDPVRLRAARLTAALDQSLGPDWKLALSIDGLTRGQDRVEQVTARVDGRLSPDTPGAVSGRIEADLQGLALGDPGLQSAIGTAPTLRFGFDLPGDDSLRFSALTLAAAAGTLYADGKISDLSGARTIDATARVDRADLARLSGLAGQALSGSASARITGTGSPSTRSFDITARAQLRDIATGKARLDPLLGGTTRIELDAASRVDGVDIRRFSMQGDALSAKAAGILGMTGTDLTFSAALRDLGRVLPELPGPVTLQGSVTQDGPGWRASARLDAPEGSFADLDARLAPDGPAEIGFKGEFARLEQLLPDFPGTLKASGQARRDAGQWRIDATMAGPAGIAVTLGGSYDEASGRADAAATGRVELAAANRMLSPISLKGGAAFDLTLKGQPGLPALSGRISTSGTSVALPLLNNAVENLTGAVTLKDGKARVDLAGQMRSGGGFRVSGPVSLSAPFDAGLSVDLQAIGLTDNVSFKSTANGQLAYAGPLAGNGRLSGRIDIGKTEIDIGATGGGVSSAPIPPIIHQGEPSAVRVTRQRAGLIDTGKAAAQGPEIGLDIVISAPGRVYVRGRGLESELGGEIRLRGTTRNVIPAGQIELIRGTLEIFGRRLELSKGLVTMQGSLEPYLDFAATSSTQDGTATLEIKGVPTALEISATSSPERPPEEALAMVIFGNQFSKLSPLKIAQLAGSLARLRGGGDPVGENARRITGADSVSVGEDNAGNPQAEIGARLSDRIYTDLSVNTKGDTEVNINLDVSRNVTLKGTVDNAGDSAVGIFFDRDY